MNTLKPLIIIVLLTSLGSTAQKKKVKDAEAIKKMCGCFEVTFNFSETFQYSKDSLYTPSKNKQATALEWAGLIANEKNKLSIQHILQVGEGKNQHIVKHWRQDWLYENTHLYRYNGNNTWVFEPKTEKNVKGQWTQKVFQVDDSPRYEGSATWVHVDGKSYWENTVDAPLPRREYTQRNDYNVTLRGNRQQITDYGWVHDQDNSKIIREKGKKDIVLAKEKGYNTYVKVANKKCKGAIDWWKHNANKWALVRGKWEKVYEKNTDLILEKKVKNKPLYKHLFADDCKQKTQISSVIDSFIKK